MEDVAREMAQALARVLRSITNEVHRKRNSVGRTTVAGGAILLSTLVIAAGALALDTFASKPAFAGGPDRSEFVPFRGSFRMSCTWGGSACGENPSYHPYKAIDFQLPEATPVLAAGGGEVTFAAATSDAVGFGNLVLIYHPGDNRTSLYAHLSAIKVTRGQRVLAGQLIGLSGHTGRGVGSHLHYAEAEGRRTAPWGRGGPGVDPGPMIGGNGANEVVYPNAWGVSGWESVNIAPRQNPYSIGRGELNRAAGDWAGWIVQWDGDNKQQKTSWLVLPAFTRIHIASSSTFNCLKGRGHRGPVPLPAATLDLLVDQYGVQVSDCESQPAPSNNAVAPHVPSPVIAPIARPAAQPLPTLAPRPVTQAAPPAQSASPPPTSPPPTSPPPTSPQPEPTPPPRTYSETTGGDTHTWTNYSNAGGYEGQLIPRYTTVQISCKVQGFRVANGNPWWYRINSSPWNDGYYASADAFYNNGSTSGSLAGTPWVDPAVPDC